MTRPILAVCGKGGVGKTAFCALLSRALLHRRPEPFCLIDADPAGGLLAAIGERTEHTLAEIRSRMIQLARRQDEAARDAIEHELDYRLLESLEERDGYALLAMGRTLEKGCYCPAHALLREAIDALSRSFSLVLIDAEAGVEQINRQVTRNVTKYLVLIDGSGRSLNTLDLIAEMVGCDNVLVVVNRVHALENIAIPDRYDVLGHVPPDDILADFDRQSRSLWDLPASSPAVQAVEKIARNLENRLTKEEKRCTL